MSDAPKTRLSTPRQPVTVALEDPIQAHGEQLAALTIRPPNGKDIRLCGFPMVFRDGGEAFEFDTEVVAQLLVRLAGIPLPSVEALSAPDFQACITTITGFFTPAPQKASSTDTSSSPAGGANSTPSSN